MTFYNSKNHYGTIAKFFHWASAILILASYLSVYYRHWFTQVKTPENWTALQLHLSFGVTIGVILILRIIWRLNTATPAPLPGSKFQHLAIHLGHYALYAVMVILVITGYLGTGVNTEYFFLFEITKFENTWLFTTVIENGFGLSFVEFEQQLDFIHKDILGAWFAWLLILGHSSAALYHHYILKDGTLRRMTSSGS